MYICGSDERAMHHLVAELLDNAMDEAIAGHASRIEVELGPDNLVTVRDNGRGIPVDPHPKFNGKSALEIIMTTLHSGAKFSKRSGMPRDVSLIRGAKKAELPSRPGSCKIIHSI